MTPYDYMCPHSSSSLLLVEIEYEFDLQLNLRCSLMIQWIQTESKKWFIYS